MATLVLYHGDPRAFRGAPDHPAPRMSPPRWADDRDAYYRDGDALLFDRSTIRSGNPDDAALMFLHAYVELPDGAAVGEVPATGKTKFEFKQYADDAEAQAAYHDLMAQPRTKRVLEGGLSTHDVPEQTTESTSAGEKE